MNCLRFFFATSLQYRLSLGQISHEIAAEFRRLSDVNDIGRPGKATDHWVSCSYRFRGPLRAGWSIALVLDVGRRQST
jgi:hypothetical protein